MTRRSRSRWYARVAAVALVGLLCSSLAASAGQAPRTDPGPADPGRDGYRIKLKSRTFTPAPGADAAGIRGQAGKRNDRVHFLIQFDDASDRAPVEAFAAAGGRLLALVTGTTYTGSADADVVGGLAGIPGVRWLGPLGESDKLDAAIRANRIGSWAKTKKDEIVLTIHGHSDVPLAALVALAERSGATVVGSIDSVPAVTVTAPLAAARFFARQDIVVYVQQVDPPLAPENDTARVALGVPAAAGPPGNLTGHGVTALVYDSGVIDQAHPDFAGRVLEVEAGRNIGDHGTHVAGIVAGSGAHSDQASQGDSTTMVLASLAGATSIAVADVGPWRVGPMPNTARAGHLVVVGSGAAQEVGVLDSVITQTIGGFPRTFLVLKAPLTKPHGVGEAVSGRNPGTPNQWRGIAPGASLRSFSSDGGALGLYDASGDLEADFKTAASHGVDLATMSLGYPTAGNCSTLGDYSATAVLADEIVRGSVVDDPAGDDQPLVFLKSAGNRGGSCTGQPFGLITSPGASKNVITVGAMNTDSMATPRFSSPGPTKDGRLKPDVAGAGCSGVGQGIVSPTFLDKDGGGTLDPGEVRNTYVPMCGTSMATPSVAGTVALMLEAWKKYADRPKPHTVKAVLVHTAKRPDAPAERLVGLTGPKNDILLRATAPGPGGNQLAVVFNDPGAPNAAIAVTQAGNTINVSLATDAAGTVTTTAAQVVANLNGVGGVQALLARDDEGGFHDGSGLVYATNPLQLSGGRTAAPGPDYEVGWGLVDAKAATDYVRESELKEQIHVAEIDDTGDETVYRIFSDGTQDMKVTLAWDDAPASALAAAALVNDLDLELVDPSGTVYSPYKLDPANPTAAATTGVDTLNNVEQAFGSKKPGMWQVKVKGTRIAFFDDQEYTLLAPPPGNSVTVTPSVTTEGDSGTRKASFVVALAHADDRQVTLTYFTTGSSAGGNDFVSTNGTLTFAPGEIEKLVEVVVNGDIEDESDEHFDLDVAYFGGTTLATARGTIVDDDGERTFTIVGKTGDTSGSLSLTGIEPRTVSINDKGQVVFVGRTGTSAYGSMGLWTGKSGEQPVLVNPTWAQNDRRVFSYPTIRNDGTIVALDRYSGAPPQFFIREWRKPLLFGDWNPSILARSGGEFDAVTTPSASVDGGYLTFLSIVGNAAYIQWGGDGADGTWGNVQAPLPVIADDGSTVFRQVMKDGNGVPDYVNAPITLVNVYGSGTGKITCSGASGCPHTGFTNVGWHPGVSRDGSVVAFYGERTAPTGTETGMWASVRAPSGGRTLVRIAKVGDSGITAFTDADQDERLGINSTQEDHKQVTVVFRATSDGGRAALYKVNIVYEGPSSAPTGYRVDGPRLVVRQGDTINGLGAVESFTIGDHPINNRNEGDIAFYARAGGVDAAVVQESSDTPLLFVPGIAGSTLYDNQRNEAVWMVGAGNLRQRDTFWSTALSMREEDQFGRDVVPADALRAVFGLLPVYGTLLDHLGEKGYKEYALGTQGANVRACDTSQLQARPNLFVFPYDWRRSNAVNAALLKNYLACLKRFYPDNKVNVMTHSMGGLLTRRTIISQPGFADEVNLLFSITPPWLGAPKLIYVLRSGDFVAKPVPLAIGPGVKRAAEALPGAHQLMPSDAYVRLAGSPYGELGRDYNRDGNPNSVYPSFDSIRALLDRKYPRFKPGATAAAFHGFAGQDDWSADTYAFKFVEMYGEHAVAKTIGGVHETTKVICEQAAQNVPGGADPSETCDTSHPLMLTWTMGDGTVPTVSAARNAAMQPPGAEIIPVLQASNGGSDDDYDHNNILKNETVLQRIVEILAANGGPPDPDAATASADGAQEQQSAAGEPSLQAARGDSLDSAAAADEGSFDAATAGPASTEVSTADASALEPAPTTVESIALHGASAVVLSDGAGNTTEPVVTPDGVELSYPLPDVDEYAVGENARIYRSTADSPLTVAFEAAGPVEVELRREDATGVVVEATRFMDVGLPDGTPLRLTTQAGAVPSLRYDGNGDGTYEAPVAADVRLTGAAAADVTPPTVTVTRAPADGDMLDVAVTAADAGSGVRSIRYSLDGETFSPYTGPIRVDATRALRLSVVAEDNAGNRGTSDEVQVGKSGAERPLAGPLQAATTEDTAVVVDLSAGTAGTGLRYALKQGADHGTVALVGSQVRYTPEPDFNGVDAFTYVVDDGVLRSAPGRVTVTVGAVNDAPRLTIVGPASVAEGSQSVLYSADVRDPEGDSVTTAWSAVGAAIDSVGTNAELTVGDGPASATITVDATDSNGEATQKQHAVAINNVAPTVLPGGARSGPWGMPISFSGLVTDPSAADNAAGFTTRWRFGDNTPDATGTSVSHVYANPGSYTATFSATDKDGATGSATSAVNVLKRNTTLAYTGSSGTVPYGYAKLSARLSDAVSAATAKLSGRRITFTVGLQALTATTDATGAGSVVLTSPLAPGTYTVTARFTGDTQYNASTAASVSLKVGSSVGSVTGTDLVSTSNGARASFNVSSMDGSTVRGTLEYLVGATAIRSTSLTPMGIAPDGKSAWFAGVSTTGQQLRVYVEDNGTTPASDRFQLWANGVLQNGAGALTGGGVTITRP